MNISQAKEELIHTVWTYLAKDEEGHYRIPRIRQRPILLMGPPGIGKTAIMEQVARECKIGLVSYTMTHHTRQSAIGLPMVQTRCFDGEEYTVTEYTMSEIIASVYGLMERTGCREGILFLDEINCVSETLAPVMLQFLQTKAFGGHKLPAGWLIAAAGNPREYNKAARDFDIATLDRVRRMNILPELDGWKNYALSVGMHGSILSYLNCRPESFYHIRQTAEGMEFVTARGWEDLSVMIKEHERQELPVTLDLIEEYLSCEEIAEDFYSYYLMTREYEKKCPVDRILKGELTEKEKSSIKTRLKNARKDETYSISGWLLSGALSALEETWEIDRICKRMKEMTESFRNYGKGRSHENAVDILEMYVQQSLHALSVKEENALISEEQILEEKKGLGSLRSCLAFCQGNHKTTEEEVLEAIWAETRKWEQKLTKKEEKAIFYVKNSVIFLQETFGIEEELLCFLAGICRHPEMKKLEEKEELQIYKEALLWLQIDCREKQVEKLLS